MLPQGASPPHPRWPQRRGPAHLTLEPRGRSGFRGPWGEGGAAELKMPAEPGPLRPRGARDQRPRVCPRGAWPPAALRARRRLWAELSPLPLCPCPPRSAPRAHQFSSNTSYWHLRIGTSSESSFSLPMPHESEDCSPGFSPEISMSAVCEQRGGASQGAVAGLRWGHGHQLPPWWPAGQDPHSGRTTAALQTEASAKSRAWPPCRATDLHALCPSDRWGN